MELLGIIALVVIGFIVLQVRKHRYHKFARSLITPEYMNDRMLEILKQYNAFSKPDRWNIGYGYIINNGNNSEPTVYISKIGREMNAITMLMQDGSGRFDPPTIYADEREPWKRAKRLPGHVNMNDYQEFECFGGVIDPRLSEWDNTITRYISSIYSREFDEAVIRAANVRFRFFG